MPIRPYSIFATGLTVMSQLGQDSEEDLAAIANATKNPEFQAKLYAVKAAIREVRGAHLQASSFLINKLLSAAPARLSRSTGAALILDIEGVGRAVVAEIESIDSEHTQVGVSRSAISAKRFFRSSSGSSSRTRLPKCRMSKAM